MRKQLCLKGLDGLALRLHGGAVVAHAHAEGSDVRDTDALLSVVLKVLEDLVRFVEL